MSYEVIARKWRPQDFDHVVGQNHITQTLKNALKNDRLPHAILFTGPRGTGKTSSARILAKTLRCESPVNFSPCNKCVSCLEITQGSSVNVIEIDGASNNGVDAIRDLRETVGYMPSSGRYKVYIIDEVHMLSTSAFNALLKTLEEPPSHVVFMMATTEVHKIPQTILSRCQRFDFRKITTRQISDHLAAICAADHITADPKALWLIARQGDGSMRDSQSLLDQVISFAAGELTADKVTDILGLTDRTLLNQVLKGLIERNSIDILEVIRKLNKIGIEPKLFCEELLELIRHVILLKVAGADGTELLDLPESEIQYLAELALKVSPEDLHLLFDMTLKGTQDVIRSTQPQIVLEVVLLRMAAAPQITDLEALIRGGARPHIALPAKESSENSVPPTPRAPAPPPKPQFLVAPTVQDKWLLFVNKIRDKDGFFAAKIENLLFLGEEVSASSKKIKLAIPAKMAFLKDQMHDVEVRNKLQGLIDSMWGQGYSLEVSMSKESIHSASSSQNQVESASAMTQRKLKEADDEIRQKIEKLPEVIAAQNVFKGKIKAIHSLKKT